MIEIIQEARVNIYRYLVLVLSILNVRKLQNKNGIYPEVGMYPAGIQPVGFGPMPNAGLARMYLSCTQTDQNSTVQY